MRVLVACEESQRVCIAFRELGHEAYSCDLLPCSGGHPEWHIQGDALQLIKIKWDLVIAHPPCTYLSNAGARWLYAGGKLNEERYEKGIKAKEFFLAILGSEQAKIAVENPMPSTVFGLPKATQYIQPYDFGHPFSKKTGFWLKGLPPLLVTETVKEHRPYVTSGSYTKTHDKRFMGESRKGGAAITRARTFPGIARAMAEQWGGDVRGT